MSIKLSVAVPLDVRLVGALVGAAFGLAVVAVGMVFADGTARATTVMLGVTVLAVAAPLGWLLLEAQSVQACGRLSGHHS